MRDDLPVRVQALLSEELELYLSLRTMVSHELEAIVLDEDMEKLLNILQEKDELISQLQLLVDSWSDVLSHLGIHEGRGMDGFWARLCEALPVNHAEELTRILEEARAAAGELMEAEERAQEELNRHVGGLREKLASMTRGREAFIGYTKMGGNTFVP